MSDPMVRMEAALQRLGAEYEPPPGWDTRVLTVIGQWHPWHHWWRRWRWWIAIPIGALCPIVVLIWFWTSTAHMARPLSPSTMAMWTAHSEALAIDVRRETVGSVMRGSSASIGDRVHITATSGDRYRAIWVYHNDRELVVVCPAGPSCNGARDTVTADVTLQIVGSYTFLAVASSSPLPEPSGSLDLDRAAAVKAGATTRMDQLKVP